jgi:hypothetical protein
LEIYGPEHWGYGFLREGKGELADRHVSGPTRSWMPLAAKAGAEVPAIELITGPLLGMF